ncbi:MAG: hypothetical protein JWO76_125 [Nocardioides sp.]|nr:hypothetical protein [Nocardioides sp.]
MTTRSGINVAWMADSNQYAESIRQRTWAALASREDWSHWLSKHIDLDCMLSFVYFEDRAKERLVLRGDSVSYYVPMNHVRAAHEMHTLPSLMSEIFRSVYVKWAEKRGLPSPPAVD